MLEYKRWTAEGLKITRLAQINKMSASLKSEGKRERPNLNYIRSGVKLGLLFSSVTKC